MKIVRAGLKDTDMFSRRSLRHGACCFFTEDRAGRYLFRIKGRQAVLFASSEQYLHEAAGEFLFYSGFVSRVVRPDGRVIVENVLRGLELAALDDIRPSQFYVSRSKLDSCKEWIKSRDDVLIPVADIGGQIVALDGHTRMRAALDMGLERIYIYRDDFDAYTHDFADEAARRGIASAADMEILSDGEYALKWHKYCDDYFAGKEK